MPVAIADAPTFGDLLRQHRRTHNLTQEALAERASISARAISDLERGLRRHPYRETAQLLASALELEGTERAAFLTAAKGAPRSQTPEVARTAKARLPQPLTPLIGRDKELAALAGLLGDERRRLVTLTGPAGVGKTRLAVAAATALAEDFADGALFIDLAPLTDADQIAAAIATALGVALQGSVPPLEVAQRALASRRLLLVLDNFEHLLTAAPTVSELLQAAPGVAVLVTSRAALRLRGEREFVLSPLPTPTPDTWHYLDEVTNWAAVQLFVTRARDGQPAFSLTDDNARVVAAICQRLDGLPLAIELAASRIRTLTPDALLARLDARLPLLNRGARDAPDRHQTLQAAIAWSYDLLAPDEQSLFCSLAVFSGGWTLEAAEEVGRARGIAQPLDALSTLCEHHLVVRDATGTAPRYRMLETLHEFARDRLAAAGEEERARCAHVRYLERLARDNDPELLDPGVEQRLQRLLAEEANLRTGIRWAIAHEPEAALQTLADLGPFWMNADLAAEGKALHLQALETSAALTSPLRARLLSLVAWLHAYAGEYTAAAPLAEKALSLAQEHGDDRVIAHALGTLGDIAFAYGDPARAQALLEETLARYTALGDTWGIFVTLNELGIAALDSGDHEVALDCFTRMGAIVNERFPNGIYRAHVLLNLADAYRLSGSIEHAEALCTRVLAMPGFNKQAALASAKHILGESFLHRGNVAQAASLFGKSLDIFWQTGDRWNLAILFEAAAAVMHVNGVAASSVRSFAAARALREAMPYPLNAALQAEVDRKLLAARHQLGDGVYTEAWSTGKHESLAEAVAHALGVLAAVASPADLIIDVS